MANEISALVTVGSTGNYALMVNPANKAQAWDTNLSTWATKDPTAADQKVSLTAPGTDEGNGYETQYANLPSGLDVAEDYEVWIYNSSEAWVGNKLYRGSNVNDALAAIADLPGTAYVTSALETATQFGPVSQEDVPANLITTMVNYEGQVLSSSENKLELVVGDSYGTGLADEAVLCAIDWTKTLGNVKRLSSFVALTLISGTEGGVTTEIIGIDHTLSKFTATPVTAGTYVYLARVKVAGSNSYRAGYVTIQVIDPAATYGT